MLHSIIGENFSGKSFYLQCYSSFPSNTVIKAVENFEKLFRDDRRSLYIGPIPEYFLSGFFQTVFHELYRYNYTDNIETSLREYMESIAFPGLHNRNPFTLSGGEKTVLAVLAFALYNPRLLAIDSTLEQLGTDWKEPLLTSLLNTSIPEILVSDNRIDELPLELFHKREYNPVLEPLDNKFVFPKLDSKKISLNSLSNFNKVTVSNLFFAYRKKKIFDDFNYEFETGKIYHLKGRNGVGKSTLSKILAGVLKPNRAQIYFDQNSVDLFRSPGRYFSYSFQQPDEQLFSSKVAEEFRLNKSNSHFNSKFKDSIIDAFGFSSLLNLHPFELPVSMRKRLAIATAIANEKPFYILDEPTLFLDNFNVVELKIILESLAMMGKGIIIISHSNSFIKQFKDIETIQLT